MPVSSNRFSMSWPIGPSMAVKQMSNRLTVPKNFSESKDWSEPRFDRLHDMPSRVAQPELVVADPYYRPMHRAFLVISANTRLPS
jgi:hypothetical protein